MPPPAASRYYCGEKCNGKAPGYVIPGNGVRCDKSEKVVATGHPKPYKSVGGGVGVNDTHLVVRVYYSTVCQTLWASLTNTGNDGRTSCTTTMTRTLRNSAGTYDRQPVLSKCPALHRTVTTAMVNDHSPSLGKAAEAYVQDCKPKSRCSNYLFTY